MPANQTCLFGICTVLSQQDADAIGVNIAKLSDSSLSPDVKEFVYLDLFWRFGIRVPGSLTDPASPYFNMQACGVGPRVNVPYAQMIVDGETSF